MQGNLKIFLNRSFAEIHLDRLRKNVHILKSFLPAGARMMAVVKADAYGHGDGAVARCLQQEGVAHFAVSNLQEAQRLREQGITGDILILGYTAGEYASALTEGDYISAVVSLEHGKALSEEAVKTGGVVRCHFAVDTGMGRIGVRPEDGADLESCAEEIVEMSRLPGLRAEGLFTHFAVADSPEEEDKQYTRRQQETFLRLVRLLERKGLHFPCVHCCNSAGSVCYPDAVSTLFRVGILLYGVLPDDSIPLPPGIEPVLDWKAEVSCVKTLPAGAFISYGRTYRTYRETRVATLTVGYADGYARLLSNKGYVLLHGCKAPVIGRICMDQMMADVTDIPGEPVRQGDMAVLLGKDGGQAITANQLGALYGTIGYEVICGISKRVPRVVL